MKTCCRCKAVKPPSEFYRNQNRCSDCDKQKARAWRQANPDRAKAALKAWKSANPSFAKRKRLKKYGISVEQYDKMLLDQGGGCAICAIPLTGKERSNVDHCHKTKKVRGILCIPCNLGIGHLKESPQIMLRAIEYLN